MSADIRNEGLAPPPGPQRRECQRSPAGLIFPAHPTPMQTRVDALWCHHGRGETGPRTRRRSREGGPRGLVTGTYLFPTVTRTDARHWAHFWRQRLPQEHSGRCPGRPLQHCSRQWHVGCSPRGPRTQRAPRCAWHTTSRHDRESKPQTREDGGLWTQTWEDPRGVFSAETLNVQHAAHVHTLSHARVSQENLLSLKKNYIDARTNTHIYTRTLSVYRMWWYLCAWEGGMWPAVCACLAAWESAGAGSSDVGLAARRKRNYGVSPNARHAL